MKAQTEDEHWHTILENLSYTPLVETKEMMLYDTKMNQIQFDTVLNKHKGKVIYIDIWASWCAPCVMSIPKGKEIIDKYKNKDFVFITLGFNDREKNWKQAIEKHWMGEQNVEHYLVASPRAEWIKQLKVSEIPRYVLYGKDGKIVNGKAPSPGNNRLSEVLDSLLKK